MYSACFGSACAVWLALIGVHLITLKHRNEDFVLTVINKTATGNEGCLFVCTLLSDFPICKSSVV